MSNLFIDTCKVLRDNLVVELQKQNNFLRNNLNKDFIGSKVKILRHGIDHYGNVQEEAKGILVKLEGGRAYVMIKEENKTKLVYISCTQIEFFEDKYVKLLNDI